MITIERRVPVNDAGDPAGPACPDGRLLALRCLGIPQVATALSRRRTLMRSLAAFCARIQPRNTAALASLVLYMGEEIDRRERMLDAALRAAATVPGERILGSPAASRPARAGPPDQIGEPAPRLTPWPSGNAPAMAGPREAARSRETARTPPATRTATALS